MDLSNDLYTETQIKCVQQLKSEKLFKTDDEHCKAFYVKYCKKYDLLTGLCVSCKSDYDKTTQDKVVTCTRASEGKIPFLIISIASFILVIVAYCKFYMRRNIINESVTISDNKLSKDEPILNIKNEQKDSAKDSDGVYYKVDDSEFDKYCEFNFQIN